MSLQETTWNDLPAFSLESDAMHVVIVPQQGGKIASLVDKRTGREWLIQPTELPIPSIPYGAPYIDHDVNSWDEMFPTIVECPYPVDGAYKGNHLPDHGEIWAMAWDVIETESDTLGLRVSGRALPYTLIRRAHLTSPDVLELRYEVQNTGDEALYYLWAAHPLFAVDTQTQIVLPEQVTELVNVHDVPPWGAHGNRYAFPHPQTNDGKDWDLRRIGPAELVDCRKFFVPPEVRVDWAGLRQDDNGSWLKLSWDAGQNPYLGLWIDEGTYVKVPTAAPEPMNGYYDSLETAYRNQQVASLEPGETARWNLRVELNDGTRPITAK